MDKSLYFTIILETDGFDISEIIGIVVGKFSCSFNGLSSFSLVFRVNWVGRGMKVSYSLDASIVTHWLCFASMLGF